MATIELLKKIYLYVGVKERFLWGGGVVLAAFAAMIGLFLPTQLNLVIQNLKNLDFSRVAVVVLLFVIQNVIMFFSLYIIGKSGEYMISSLRKETLQTILNSGNFHLESTTWASRVIYDPTFFSDLISRQFPTLIINSLQLILSMAILFYLNFKLTFLIVAGILIIIFYSILSGKILSKIQISFQEFLSTTNQQFSDTLGRLQLIKINNTFDREYRSLDKSIKKIYLLSVRLLRASVFNQIGLQLLFILVSFFIVFIIIGDIASGILKLSSITLYIMYCVQIAAPILTISEEITGIKKSMEVITEYFNKIHELRTVISFNLHIKSCTRTQIEIFDFINPFNKKTIKYLNFSEGNVYQLTGSSGVGKTTLLNAILGLMNVNKGLIRVTLKSDDTFYNRIAYYQSQQQLLVNKSIRENLSYSSIIPDEEMLDTLQKFGLSEELDSDGILDLIVTEKTLSKGQISRLVLAREYLKRESEIVILDEPYAHLDTFNSIKIDKMFRSRFSNSILIIVNHTKTLHKENDRIIEMV